MYDLNLSKALVPAQCYMQIDHVTIGGQCQSKLA